MAEATRAPSKAGCALVLTAAIVGVVLCARMPWIGVPILATSFGWLTWSLVRASRAYHTRRVRQLARFALAGEVRDDVWRKLFEGEGLGDLVSSTAPRVRKAVRIETHATGEPVALGASRVGGAPDLPSDFAWPTENGTPLTFVAQIDLAAVRDVMPSSSLPADGWLLFFCETTAFDAGAVRYVAGDAALERTANDSGAPFRACAVTLMSYDDVPDPDNVVLDDARGDAYYDVRAYLSAGERGATQHKLLGHAQPIQDAMMIPGATIEGTLLLQLDGDDGARIMLGDAGMLYFWMRGEDLAAHRFERAWCVMQCH